jgi:predicted ATPase/class 3 adenylate cyclase
MASLPSGTVTMLFSDIEGSTLLLSRLGNRYVEALDAQRSLLRGAWHRAGGHEMGTEGDSFFVVFQSARDAAAAALDAQRGMSGHQWPGGERVRIRMGLHTGEPVAHGDDYVGMDVHRAARVAGVAHGGQVVITDTTARLIAGALPEGARLDDLGQHQLKDLAMPEHLYQLTADGMDTAFPPLRSLGTAAGLPQQLTPLVGRDGDLNRVVELLAAPDVRLVTLTGPGGSGKTRLSIAAAAAVGDAFPDGVYFVSFAGVNSAESMWSGLADVVGQPGTSRTRDQVIAQVSSLRLLLVLDNLEQIAEADSVVAELLSSAARITVLATSRRPLHLRSEHDFAVTPLSVKDDSQEGQSAAVRLFCLYAQMARSSFVLDEAAASAVATICRRLDGLPLAIELAAARCRLLSPAALLDRLDATFASPSGADRPQRHRTLRKTMAWSYDLLPPELQTVFRRLGVFAGAADLNAVRAVCSPRLDPLDAVASLADASLVQVTEGINNEPQVNLLQTVRAYARECLAESDELEQTRKLHAAYFLELAQTLAPLLHSPRQLNAAERLSDVDEDLDVALDWALQPDGHRPTPSQAAVGLRLVAALWWHWTANGQWTKRRRWCERAIEVAPDGDSLEKAATLHALELQNTWVKDPDPGLPRSRMEEALAMYQRLGDFGGMAEVANTLAQLYVRLGETDKAHALFEHAVDWALKGGDDGRRTSALHYFADLLRVEGDAEGSLALIQQARDLACKMGDERDALRCDLDLASTLLDLGRTAQAQDVMCQRAADVLRVREPQLNVMTISFFVGLFVQLGDAERAARLQGALETLGTAIGWSAQYTMPSGHGKQRQDALREAIGTANWDRGRDDGRTWSAQQALDFVAATNPAQ